MPSPFLRAADDLVSGESDLLSAYRKVRARSVALAAPLSPEDQGAQSMPDASPAKWHLAHTTWFFETFILLAEPDYAPFDERFSFLFNSYYEALGPRHSRPSRGLLTRPSADTVLAYRKHVDRAMEQVLAAPALTDEQRDLVVLGFSHEEQHQELLLTDILHLFAQNPLKPAYDKTLSLAEANGEPGPLTFSAFDGGVVEIGRAETAEGFAFDNEGPRHQVLLRAYRLADRLITNGEWLEFMADGGYARPEFWLSDGWALVQEEGWRAPLYWEETQEGWSGMTLAGLRSIDLNAPVTHLSFYEADAYAHWCGLRLPTEAEWEHAAANLAVRGNFIDSGDLRPRSPEGEGLRQLFGDCWEWTSSAYAPYPGFVSAAGAVGEYNGKFMINQMVLRGGSCATPEGHVRATYRNFFHPHQRWQFSGLRLAADGVGERSDVEGFRKDVLNGLGATPKTLPSKYFYDKRGSELFEKICELKEYYPTRTEGALLAEIAPEIAAAIPDGAVMLEYGSGASTKTRVLLDAARQLSAYAPMDISRDALAAATAAIRRDYPALQVEPIVGDFTRRLDMPKSLANRPKVGFFPGSTIGNFPPDEARAFLEEARRLLGEGAHFIVGVDIAKAEAVMVAAYDDAEGVTADFNLNLLERINRELGGDFEPAAFRHEARWNPVESRMEMHLVSNYAQAVDIAGQRFKFDANESIHTENSYKYSVKTFTDLVKSAGWVVDRVWTSSAPTFSIFMLSS